MSVEPGKTESTPIKGASPSWAMHKAANHVGSQIFFEILQIAVTFCVSNINTNKWYKRSFAQISLLLLVLDMAFLYSKIQGGIMQKSIVSNNF